MSISPPSITTAPAAHNIPTPNTTNQRAAKEGQREMTARGDGGHGTQLLVDFLAPSRVSAGPFGLAAQRLGGREWQLIVVRRMLGTEAEGGNSLLWTEMGIGGPHSS